MSHQKRKCDESEKACECELLAKREVERLLAIENEQTGILGINVSDLESKIDHLQQRLEAISLTKALFSNVQESMMQCAADDEVQPTEDLLRNIEAMHDDKNTMIKQLLEELETMKNVHGSEVEEKNTYISDLEELLKEKKLNLSSMKDKASELAETLDVAHSYLSEKDVRIDELEEYVKLTQLNLVKLGLETAP